jgi:hypothetical protein
MERWGAQLMSSQFSSDQVSAIQACVGSQVSWLRGRHARPELPSAVWEGKGENKALLSKGGVLPLIFYFYFYLFLFQSRASRSVPEPDVVTDTIGEERCMQKSQRVCGKNGDAFFFAL